MNKQDNSKTVWKQCKKCNWWSPNSKKCLKCGNGFGWLSLRTHILNRSIPNNTVKDCPKCGEPVVKPSYNASGYGIMCIKCGYSEFIPVKPKPKKQGFIRFVDPEKELIQGINPIMNKINADRFAQGEAKRAAAKAEATAQAQLEEIKKQNALLKKLLEEKESKE